MSKIEDALEKAARMRKTGGKQFIDKSSEIDSPKEESSLSIRIDKNSIDNHIIRACLENTLLAEEFKRLKSMIIRETKSDFLNTLMITSSVDSEGKTLTAINLAITLAQDIDHSVVLIDADLRKPMIHEYLNIESKYGLSDYLLNEKLNIKDILVDVGIGKMQAITAGQHVKNPVELLSSHRMEDLIKELKRRYVDRYVLIDTPPVLPFADSMTIGEHTDGVIFVIRSESTQKSDIEEAIGILKDLKIIGIVYNRVEMTSLNGYYPYNYTSYYRYRKEKK